MKNPKSVEIVNPIDGYARTSYRRAMKFVSSDVAKFTPEGRLIFTAQVASLSQAFRGPIRPPVRVAPQLPDLREFPVDHSFQDERAVIKFWEDQRSCVEARP